PACRGDIAIDELAALVGAAAVEVEVHAQRIHGAHRVGIHAVGHRQFANAADQRGDHRMVLQVVGAAVHVAHVIGGVAIIVEVDAEVAVPLEAVLLDAISRPRRRADAHAIVGVVDQRVALDLVEVGVRRGEQDAAVVVAEIDAGNAADLVAADDVGRAVDLDAVRAVVANDVGATAVAGVADHVAATGQPDSFAAVAGQLVSRADSDTIGADLGATTFEDDALAVEADAIVLDPGIGGAIANPHACAQEHAAGVVAPVLAVVAHADLVLVDRVAIAAGNVDTIVFHQRDAIAGDVVAVAGQHHPVVGVAVDFLAAGRTGQHESQTIPENVVAVAVHPYGVIEIVQHVVLLDRVVAAGGNMDAAAVVVVHPVELDDVVVGGEQVADGHAMTIVVADEVLHARVDIAEPAAAAVQRHAVAAVEADIVGVDQLSAGLDPD